MMDLPIPHGIWRHLCTSSSAEVVLKRLASSRAYSQVGVLPSFIGIPQPHVRVQDKQIHRYASIEAIEDL